MKGVQCYELFGGIALKNHTFSFFYLVFKAWYFAAVIKALVSMFVPHSFCSFIVSGLSYFCKVLAI